MECMEKKEEEKEEYECPVRCGCRWNAWKKEMMERRIKVG
jgi:hypothetical protein